MLNALDSKRGYERVRTDPVPGFVVSLAKVLLISKENLRNGATILVISILLSAPFDAEVFTSYLKIAGNVTTLCHQVSEVKIVSNGFKKRFLKAWEGLEANGSVFPSKISSRGVNPRLDWRDSDDVMFRVDCCDENTS